MAGVPVGVVWWLIAPLTLVQKRADGLFRAGGEVDESAIAADGWFALVALAAGILVALVVYLRTRPGRVGPLLALAAGGFLGAVVAWRTGVLLGPGALEATARGLPIGAKFHGPLAVSAYGVLLAWPMGAVITYFAVAAGAESSEHRDSDYAGSDHADTDRADDVGPDDDAGARGDVSSSGEAERSDPR